MNKAHVPIDPNTTRKDYPLYSGLLAYFPNALAYVSYVSKKANDQHNPGEPLHWAREKSTDHLDCLLRHLARAGERDDDGLLESGKVAWRALAQLETELEQLREKARDAAEVYEERLEEDHASIGNLINPTSLFPKEKPKTLYDWSEAPEWAMWAATGQGMSGLSCWFKEKPVLVTDYYHGWETTGKWKNMSKNAAPETDWQDSLEDRPT